MTQRLRIALCQINPTVGDLEGNSKKILDFYGRACREFGPDLVVFPECGLVGYPPEDLLLRESFVQANLKALQRLARRTGRAGMIVGFVAKREGKIYNAAAVLGNQRVLSVYEKCFLPNYGVFDEKRYFSPGTGSGLIRLSGVKLGISICEDLWLDEEVRFLGNAKVRAVSPILRQARSGAAVLINISASPYHAGKLRVRLDLLKARARRTGRPLLYVNLVGAQDELVFDGRSMAVDARGKLVCLARPFQEDVRCVELTVGKGKTRIAPVASPAGPGAVEPLLEKDEEIYQALVLGVRDYVGKNGFKNVIVGLSGGIDSALTACIARDAVGRAKVTGVTMPSRYSSGATRGDARKVADGLGIRFLNIPIEKIFKAFLETMAPVFKGLSPGVAEENLQSRIRGSLLMALSNKFGSLVLTTGNKSEVSVGYCTLYGDTAGGFAVLKDVPKTVVYRLSKRVNRKAGREVIPRTTISRAPTAELRPNQKDQNSLPPYDLLDEIIKLYVEEDGGLDDLLKRGFPRETVKKVLRMIDSSEYKRRQSPPGVKITPKSFGKDRRMPITNRFREV